MPDRVTAFDFQRRFGSTFQRVRSGEHLIVTYDGVDSAAVIPIEDYRQDVPMSDDQPVTTYAQIDADRRTQFKRDTLDRIQALVGRDKLEALRLLTELQTELLANGTATP